MKKPAVGSGQAAQACILILARFAFGEGQDCEGFALGNLLRQSTLTLHASRKEKGTKGDPFGLEALRSDTLRRGSERFVGSHVCKRLVHPSL